MKKILAAMILTAFAAGVTASAAMPFGDRGPGPVPPKPGAAVHQEKDKRIPPGQAKKIEKKDNDRRDDRRDERRDDRRDERRDDRRDEHKAPPHMQKPDPRRDDRGRKAPPRRETAMTKTITTRTMADSSGKSSNRSKTDRREGPSSEGLFVCRNLDIYITRFI